MRCHNTDILYEILRKTSEYLRLAGLLGGYFYPGPPPLEYEEGLLIRLDISRLD
jgi:hypothetical protein